MSTAMHHARPCVDVPNAAGNHLVVLFGMSCRAWARHAEKSLDRKGSPGLCSALRHSAGCIVSKVKGRSLDPVLAALV